MGSCHRYHILCDNHSVVSKTRQNAVDVENAATSTWITLLLVYQTNLTSNCRELRDFAAVNTWNSGGATPCGKIFVNYQDIMIYTSISHFWQVYKFVFYMFTLIFIINNVIVGNGICVIFCSFFLLMKNTDTICSSIKPISYLNKYYKITNIENTSFQSQWMECTWEKVKVELSWKSVVVCTSALFLENFPNCTFVLCYISPRGVFMQYMEGYLLYQSRRT